MARRHTPYYHKFLDAGAELGDRIGFDAAVVFTSVEDEHLATRGSVGVYDVYYQGPIDIKGPDAEALLQKVLVRDVAAPAERRGGAVLLALQRGGRDDRRPHLLPALGRALLAHRDPGSRRDGGIVGPRTG